MIVQNLPVPLDRRVWLECNALIESGFGVSVICPKGPGDPAYEEINGVRIYKYKPPPAAQGLVGYVVEFGYCWLRTLLLSVRVFRRDGFDVVQACNPPDTFWALALPYKLLGKKFVYDQHDLNPEVFLSRFGKPTGLAARLQYRILLWLERRTYRTADHVIATNDSYRAIALRRGGRSLEEVTVVRSGPDTTRMRPRRGNEALRCGRRYLLVYLGIMGPQDGVDIAVRALDVLVHQRGRTDVHLALLGFGDCLDELKNLSNDLELTEYVTFTGRVGPDDISQYLSTADIGVSPDPLNPLNDISTMNKTMEYMSYAVPVVAFDLTETRVSGGDAVAYVLPAAGAHDVDAVVRFADAINELLDDADRRAEMGLDGRRRAETLLDWAPQRTAYVAVFDRLLDRVSAQIPRAVDASGDAALPGRLIDTSDDAAVREFARTRGIPDAS